MSTITVTTNLQDWTGTLGTTTLNLETLTFAMYDYTWQLTLDHHATTDYEGGMFAVASDDGIRHEFWYSGPRPSAGQMCEQAMVWIANCV
jgi:hypothetical protein